MVKKLLFICCAVSAVASPPNRSLSFRDADAVALKYNTGESVMETAYGIRGSANGILKGAVNLLFTNAFPLFVTDGPSSNGIVQFGFMNRTNWFPTDRDGFDLGGGDTGEQGDRVFVSVDAVGSLKLVSAARFSLGVTLATNRIELNPNTPLSLVIEPMIDLARVYYGTQLVAQGDPFLGGEMAVRTNIGSDFVVSILGGPEFLGSATVNFLARDPVLRVHDFPKVIARWNAAGTFPLARTADLVFRNETVQLALPLMNYGSTTASNITAELIASTSTRFRVINAGPVSYGDIQAGITTSRIFTVDIGDTSVGVYPLRVKISGGWTQEIQTWLVVNEKEVTVQQVGAGRGEIHISTPFAEHFTSIEAPEVFAGGDVERPLYFDLKRLTHRMVYKQPYPSVHWGDARLVRVFPSGPGPVRGLTASTEVLAGGSAVKIRGGSRTGVAGATVTIENVDTKEKKSTTTDEGGHYDFGKLPFGARYTLHFEPPPALKKFVRAFWSEASEPIVIDRELLVQGVFIFPIIEIPCPPDETSGDASAPPPNAQGQSGSQAGTPVPGPPTPPPPPPVKPKRTWWGLISNVGTGLVAGGINVLAAPETLGGSVVSLVASAGAGGVVSWLIDPEDQDLFYFGEEMTKPDTTDELTTEEKVDVTFNFAAPPLIGTTSIVQTAYTFTRTTTAKTYTYTGSETRTVPLWLAMSLTTAQPHYSFGERIELTAQTPPEESDLLVQVLVYPRGGNTLLAEGLLHDDGQGTDQVAGDGRYSGTLPVPAFNGLVDITAFAIRSGFYSDSSPVRLGFATSEAQLSVPEMRIVLIEFTASQELVIVAQPGAPQNFLYVLQSAASISGPWAPEANIVIVTQADGSLRITTGRPVERARFYRLQATVRK